MDDRNKYRATILSQNITVSARKECQMKNLNQNTLFLSLEKFFLELNRKAMHNTMG
jgi:hypothetical protein